MIWFRILYNIRTKFKDYNDLEDTINTAKILDDKQSNKRISSLKSYLEKNNILTNDYISDLYKYMNVDEDLKQLVSYVNTYIKNIELDDNKKDDYKSTIQKIISSNGTFLNKKNLINSENEKESETKDEDIDINTLIQYYNDMKQNHTLSSILEFVYKNKFNVLNIKNIKKDDDDNYNDIKLVPYIITALNNPSEFTEGKINIKFYEDFLNIEETDDAKYINDLNNDATDSNIKKLLVEAKKYIDEISENETENKNICFDIIKEYLTKTIDENEYGITKDFLNKIYDNDSDNETATGLINKIIKYGSGKGVHGFSDDNIAEIQKTINIMINFILNEYNKSLDTVIENIKKYKDNFSDTNIVTIQGRRYTFVQCLDIWKQFCNPTKSNMYNEYGDIIDECVTDDFYIKINLRNFFKDNVNFSKIILNIETSPISYKSSQYNECFDDSYKNFSYRIQIDYMNNAINHIKKFFNNQTFTDLSNVEIDKDILNKEEKFIKKLDIIYNFVYNRVKDISVNENFSNIILMFGDYVINESEDLIKYYNALQADIKKKAGNDFKKYIKQVHFEKPDDSENEENTEDSSTSAENVQDSSQINTKELEDSTNKVIDSAENYPENKKQ